MVEPVVKFGVEFILVGFCEPFQPRNIEIDKLSLLFQTAPPPQHSEVPDPENRHYEQESEKPHSILLTTPGHRLARFRASSPDPHNTPKVLDSSTHRDYAAEFNKVWAKTHFELLTSLQSASEGGIAS